VEIIKLNPVIKLSHNYSAVLWYLR